MVPARFVVSVFVSVSVSVAPLVFRAPEGPAAREARRPHFVRRRASKPARALRTLRRPSRRWCLWFWCARPGPAATHGRCSQARFEARPCAPVPPAPFAPVVPVVLVCPARPRRHSRALRPGPASKLARALRSLRCPRAGGLWFWCARPGPAATHGHRSLALCFLRRPPHRRCLWFWCARPGPATAHGRRR